MPSTNSVTVCVTDSGVPPLSASGTFTIVVSALPWLDGVTLPDDVSLQFDAGTLPGRRYQVLFKEDLAVPGWTPLGLPQTAAGYQTTFTVEIGTNSQRFYRIEILP